MVFVYARSENGKKIVLLEANRESLRCRQRNRNIDNSKVITFKFMFINFLIRVFGYYNKFYKLFLFI